MATRPEGAPPSEIARRRMERRLAGGRRSDARWQEILAGAARVFRRTGYAMASLDEVAREVGINRATLYYYVGAKEELLVALLHDPLRRVLAGLEEAAGRQGSATEKFTAALRSYVAMMDEHPELFVFLAENVHRVMSGPEADDIRGYADRYGRILAGVIAEGAAAGEFRADVEPMTAVLGVIGMFNWMHRWYRPDGPRTLIELGEVYITMALSALGARSPG